MRVVLDTNVLVSGLITPAGSPGRILNAVFARRLTLVLTSDLAMELLGVLVRPKFRGFAFDRRRLSNLVSAVQPIVIGDDVAIPRRDPGDRIVVEAAVAGRAEAIVTGDRDLLDDVELVAWLTVRGIEVITPAELTRRLGR